MEKSIKKILVTGSSGTIGTGLCDILLRSGYEVIGIDLKENQWKPEIEAVTIRGDLRDPAVFGSVPKDIDLVVHLAANARVYNLVEEPRLARDNLETTFNTLNFAREQNITHFLFASSREVYGNEGETIHAEDDVSLKSCESPYTASKLGGEAFVQAFQQCYGISFIILRFSNVYGKYDDSDRLIPLYIQLAAAGKDLLVYGKDKMLDFTYIDDCVLGIQKAIDHFEEAKNETYNIASGKGNLIEHVAELVKSYMNSTSIIVIKESKIGEVVKYVGDISKAKQHFGHEPVTHIEDGLQKTIQWYQDQHGINDAKITDNQ